MNMSGTRSPSTNLSRKDRALLFLEHEGNKRLRSLGTILYRLTGGRFTPGDRGAMSCPRCQVPGTLSSSAKSFPKERWFSSCHSDLPQNQLLRTRRSSVHACTGRLCSNPRMGTTRGSSSGIVSLAISLSLLPREPILIERVYGLLAKMPWSLLLPVAGFGHYLMTSRMLRSTKRRAERRRPGERANAKESS